MAAAHPGIPEEDHRDLILAWYRRARRAQHDHGRAAAAARSAAVWWTLLGLALGVSAGASALIDSLPWNELPRQVVSSALAVLAVVATALPTLSNLGGAVDGHQRASRDYGTIRRELATVGLDDSLSRRERTAELNRLRLELDKIALASPNLPRRIWETSASADDNYFPPEFRTWPSAS